MTVITFIAIIIALMLAGVLAVEPLIDGLSSGRRLRS